MEKNEIYIDTPPTLVIRNSYDLKSREAYIVLSTSGQFYNPENCAIYMFFGGSAYSVSGEYFVCRDGKFTWDLSKVDSLVENFIDKIIPNGVRVSVLGIHNGVPVKLEDLCAPN